MEQLFGFLNIAKPPDLTSRDVVNRIQRLVRPTKVGHAGTLDPMAVGVLIVSVGPATRLTDFLHQFPKSYRADFRFGARSDTDDSTGHVEQVHDVMPVTYEELQAALPNFIGEIEQVPPKFSAVKIGGRRAYKLARKGEDVEIKPKQVTVHSIDIANFEYPNATLDITCGSGTYIRSIGRDLGEHFGCGGIMTGLSRIRIGPFSLVNGVALDAIESIDDVREHLQSPSIAIECVSHLVCTGDERDHLVHGRRIQFDESKIVERPQPFRQDCLPIIGPDRELVCLARLSKGGGLSPVQVFARG